VATSAGPSYPATLPSVTPKPEVVKVRLSTSSSRVTSKPDFGEVVVGRLDVDAALVVRCLWFLPSIATPKQAFVEVVVASVRLRIWFAT
jgi:hypothetical protein